MVFHGRFGVTMKKIAGTLASKKRNAHNVKGGICSRLIFTMTKLIPQIIATPRARNKLPNDNVFINIFLLVIVVNGIAVHAIICMIFYSMIILLHLELCTYLFFNILWIFYGL